MKKDEVCLSESDGGVGDVLSVALAFSRAVIMAVTWCLSVGAFDTAWRVGVDRSELGGVLP